MRRTILLGLMLLLSINTVLAEGNTVSSKQLLPVSIPYAEPLYIGNSQIENQIVAPVPITDNAEIIQPVEAKTLEVETNETVVTEIEPVKNIESEAIQTSDEVQHSEENEKAAENSQELEEPFEAEAIELELTQKNLFIPNTERKIIISEKVNTTESNDEFSINTKSFYNDNQFKDIKNSNSENTTSKQDYKLNPDLSVKNFNSKSNTEADNIENLQVYVDSQPDLRNSAVQSKFSAGEPANNPYGLKKTIRF